jgi:hypothetical protein
LPITSDAEVTGQSFGKGVFRPTSHHRKEQGPHHQPKFKTHILGESLCIANFISTSQNALSFLFRKKKKENLNSSTTR